MATSPHQFEIQPSSGTPIYRQLIEQVRAMVAGGRLKPGELLPSVRRVAAAAEVNPMTVSKAYSRLEDEGVVERVRGQGMRVCEPADGGTAAERQAQLRTLIEPALHRAYQLGLSAKEIRRVFESVLKDYQK